VKTPKTAVSNLQMKIKPIIDEVINSKFKVEVREPALNSEL